MKLNPDGTTLKGESTEAVSKVYARKGNSARIRMEKTCLYYSQISPEMGYASLQKAVDKTYVTTAWHTANHPEEISSLIIDLRNTLHFGAA
ncbi:MAG: hypothetical protein ACLFOZ_06075 [Cyclobacteriaceae bacterium]